MWELISCLIDDMLTLYFAYTLTCVFLQCDIKKMHMHRYKNKSDNKSLHEQRGRNPPALIWFLRWRISDYAAIGSFKLSNSMNIWSSGDDQIFRCSQIFYSSEIGFWPEKFMFVCRVDICFSFSNTLLSNMSESSSNVEWAKFSMVRSHRCGIMGSAVQHQSRSVVVFSHFSWCFAQNHSQ